MQQVVGTVALWTAILAEVAIFSFVIYFSIRSCVPWDDIREKRLIRSLLRGRLPAHRERIRRLLARARHPVRRYRARWARRLADDITRDAVRLAEACGASLDTVERHLQTWPREAVQIEDDVLATLSCIERMLELRDERVPEIVRFRADVAREVIASLASVRDAVAVRIEECAAAGCAVAYERRCIGLLSNAFIAYGAAADDDPDAVFAQVQKWRDRLSAIAVSAELRHAVAARVAEAGSSVPQRIARIRQLLSRSQPLLSHLAKAAPGRLIDRLVAITAAESGIGNAERHLRAAQTLASEEGTDVGADGASAGRLKEALRMAERADQFLQVFEEDLLVASAAFEAANGTDPSRSN